jgi:hypothetical protein
MPDGGGEMVAALATTNLSLVCPCLSPLELDCPSLLNIRLQSAVSTGTAAVRLH